MVCTENDISHWDDFPKGLRVLLLDADADADTTSKLQSSDYVVTTFTDANEALRAFSEKPERFHIAVVEVNAKDKDKSFKFLEAAKDLPTIMTSRDHCLATMMKCIALGAVEFLRKPLSEDKLRNIWQHVVHRAFNDGGSTVPESLKPVKESVASMLHLELGNQDVNGENIPQGKEKNAEMLTDEKDTAPSTPQLKHSSKFLVDGDCQENVNCSTEKVNSSSEKESMEDRDMGESKSVETSNRTSDGNPADVKEERMEGEGETEEAKSENTASVDCQKKDNIIKEYCKPDHPSNKPSRIKNVPGNKANRKKVDWTPELHKKFVKAVEQLGVEQAIPSRILELMKVGGLTRHNIASHLQKFRMHRRNILPKKDHNRRWMQPGENHRQMQPNMSGFGHRPVMAYPAPPMYGVWGVAGAHPPPPPIWPPSDSWHWKPPPYPPLVHGNAWGCPVMPPCNASSRIPTTLYDDAFRIPPCNLLPEEEEIDKVVKEAMSKPWLPLPLGLKPPSPDSVFAELSRQRISAVPSPFPIDGSPLL